MNPDFRAETLAEKNYCLRMQVEKLQLVSKWPTWSFQSSTAILCLEDEHNKHPRIWLYEHTHIISLACLHVSCTQVAANLTTQRGVNGSTGLTSRVGTSADQNTSREPLWVSGSALVSQCVCLVVLSSVRIINAGFTFVCSLTVYLAWQGFFKGFFWNHQGSTSCMPCMTLWKTLCGLHHCTFPITSAETSSAKVLTQLFSLLSMNKTLCWDWYYSSGHQSLSHEGHDGVLISAVVVQPEL